MLCLTAVLDALVGRPVRNASDRAVLAVLVTFAIWTTFFWWTMHFLLAGRVPWRRLLPSAILTGVFFAVPGCSRGSISPQPSSLTAGPTGPIGAVFSILTWFMDIGAVIILGAVAGVVREDRRTGMQPEGGRPRTPRTG